MNVVCWRRNVWIIGICVATLNLEVVREEDEPRAVALLMRADVSSNGDTFPVCVYDLRSTYAQMVTPRNTSLSFLVRIPMPIVLAIVWVIVYQESSSVVAGLALAAALAAGIAAFFRGIVGIIETT